MAGAKDFQIELDEEFAEKVEGGLLRLVQTVAMEVDAGVRAKTPVDTGNARASWNTSLNEPVYREQPAIGHPGNASAVAGMTKPEVVYVTNSAEYISALENGHSKQAPQGMVALTIAEVEAKYSRTQ